MSERRKKRRPRNKRGGGGGGSSNASSQWQLQQTKVTIRNIEDSTKFGSVESILTMIGQLINNVNDTNHAQTNHIRPIKLDVKSIENIRKVEHMIAVKEKERMEKADGDENGKEVASSTTPENDAKMRDVEKIEPPPKIMASVVSKVEEAAKEGESSISARVLYIVPAKKSRRRGEKSGCAYLVLTAPPPPAPRTPAVETSPPVRVVVQEAPLKEESVVANHRPQSVEKTNLATGDDKMQIDGMNVTKAASVQNKDTTTGIKTLPVPVYSQAEKSRWTAVGKLQLLNAIDAMTALADQDAKTSQLFGKCQVAASISGKAWRDKEGGHRDRREGTIENTADFKQFFSKQNKAVEERQSRPKPAPGGGVVSENGEAGEQISAIVMHLRAKRQESSQRKKAKKKANKDVKKGKQPQESGRGRKNPSKGKGSGRSRKDGSKKNVDVPKVMRKAG